MRFEERKKKKNYLRSEQIKKMYPIASTINHNTTRFVREGEGKPISNSEKQIIRSRSERKEEERREREQGIFQFSL